MPTAHADADLVSGHLAGDPSALAGIYDRYADSLHDTAAAMLNDRNDAADVTQDVFLIAAQRLGQLRDPDRLKPWLFAILRNEVYRRTKQRRRTVAWDFTDGADAGSGIDMADTRATDADTEAVEEAELAALVRGAARGLDERDQLVLELSVRQGLEGQDLADALGVSANQSYTLVHRMRDRVQRSLGAFCVARAGRKDCPELDRMLGAWDGEFTVLIRKRIARHIDGCEACEDNRRRLAPLALFGAAPVLAAPPTLRSRVLDAAASATSSPEQYGFTADGGFPRLRRARRGASWIPATAAASILLVAASAGFWWLSATDRSSVRTADAEVTTTAAPPTTAAPTTAGATAPPSTVPPTAATPASTTTSTAPTTTAPPTSPPTTVPAPTVVFEAAPPAPTPSAPPATAPPAPPPTAPPPTAPPPTAPPPTAPPAAPPPTAPPPTAPPTTAAPPGRLSASGGTIDLGASAASGSMQLSNVGGQPVSWSLSGDLGPFGVSPTSGQLAPGASVPIVASVDRTGWAEGDVQATLSIDSPGAGALPLVVRASAEYPPVIRLIRFPNSSYCLSSWNGFGFVAEVTDASPISGVSFAWTDPSGTRGSVAANRSGSTWSASNANNVSTIAGTWTWSVTATDSRGNSATTGGSSRLDDRC